MYISYDAESLRTKKKPQTPVKRLASTIQKYVSFANFWLHHESPKTSSAISANLKEGWILPGGVSPHWLQEEPGWDFTPDFQSCKYSWDESNELYQNTHRFREGLENRISLCILAHHPAHCWWLTVGCARARLAGGHGVEMLLVASNKYLFGSVLPYLPHGMRSRGLLNTELGWPTFCPIVWLSLLKGGWQGKRLWDSCDTGHITSLPVQGKMTSQNES